MPECGTTEVVDLWLEERQSCAPIRPSDWTHRRGSACPCFAVVCFSLYQNVSQYPNRELHFPFHTSLFSSLVASLCLDTEAPGVASMTDQSLGALPFGMTLAFSSL